MLILRPFKKERICCWPSQEIRQELDRLKTLILLTKLKAVSDATVIQQTRRDLTDHTDVLLQRKSTLAPSNKRIALRKAEQGDVPSISGNPEIMGLSQTAAADSDGRTTKRRRIAT